MEEEIKGVSHTDYLETIHSIIWKGEEYYNSITKEEFRKLLSLNRRVENK